MASLNGTTVQHPSLMFSWIDSCVWRICLHPQICIILICGHFCVCIFTWDCIKLTIVHVTLLNRQKSLLNIKRLSVALLNWEKIVFYQYFIFRRLLVQYIFLSQNFLWSYHIFQALQVCSSFMFCFAFSFCSLYFVFWVCLLYDTI